MERGSGLLVHITSLPSPHGIGTFGSAARRFIRFLVSAKQKYWQILPLNPTGFADSPYQSFLTLNEYPFHLHRMNFFEEQSALMTLRLPSDFQYT